MVKIKSKVLVVFLGLFLFSCAPLVLADDHGQWGGDHHGAVVVNRHQDHYYRNGRWYRHGWFGFGVAVPVLSTGVYVNTLPPAYTPVVVQGTTYYYGDNTYFQPSPNGGYVVVSTPR